MTEPDNLTALKDLNRPDKRRARLAGGRHRQVPRPSQLAPVTINRYSADYRAYLTGHFGSGSVTATLDFARIALHHSAHGENLDHDR